MTLHWRSQQVFVFVFVLRRSPPNFVDSTKLNPQAGMDWRVDSLVKAVLVFVFVFVV
jgi:flagellar biosynthesis protein FlhB